MPQTEPTVVVGPHTSREEPNAAVERNEAAIQLLDAWLRKDAPTLAGRMFGERSVDSWDQLKDALDLDRPSARKLFP